MSKWNYQEYIVRTSYVRDGLYAPHADINPSSQRYNTVCSEFGSRPSTISSPKFFQLAHYTYLNSDRTWSVNFRMKISYILRLYKHLKAIVQYDQIFCDRSAVLCRNPVLLQREIIPYQKLLSFPILYNYALREE